MMRTRWTWLIIAGWLVSASACDEPEPAAEPAKQAEPAPAPAPVAQAEEAEPTADELPIAEDFADEAESAITADNYLAQLEQTATELETELTAPPEK